MLNFIDRLSDVCGKVAALLFFVIGGMITYEVIVRYVFLSPTIWAEEIARFVQIWGTYLAAGYVLRNRNLIKIELLTERLGKTLQRILEGVALIFVGVFCVVAIYYGTQIVAESVEIGRATSTMLSVPRWMTESAIPIGFGILLLQCMAEFTRLISGASR
ncbi:MAG: TRAP transporter small permease [Rhodospirillales bacterium]|nr:TRAP transporter small permease [Rhodospirillales bacterium]